MRVAITGAGGFVGPWLAQELEAHGHDVVRSAGRQPDVTDPAALSEWIERSAPAALVHLAGVSTGKAATAEPARAIDTNVGGTVHLLEATRSVDPRPVVLIPSSSEVYARPSVDELPLDEDSRLGPRGPYAQSKLAQESVALALGARSETPVVVARAFNHTGPGQGPDFVVPALAERVTAVATGRAASIPVGNLDVARDLLDVRDVARAYRLLIEGAVGGVIGHGMVVNVSSGRSVTIRDILQRLCDVAGVHAPVEVDPTLVRADEPPEIRGDFGRIEALVGWRPTIALETTIDDVLHAAEEATRHG
ncbi:MAG TPA: GDP-mannose 4,6-dehydratase [Candidatus Limnocylindrales bacterium]|nr:GDP-mannose 4,6-dehydratase [Candidatus Limnocylindrales bacterium]